jgi:hypothetical protein
MRIADCGMRNAERKGDASGGGFTLALVQILHFVR